MEQRQDLTRDGGSAPEQDVVAQAYARLRRIAARIMQSERAGHTLCPTELVNEAFARQLQGDGLASADLVELITYVSRSMRQVLVDHARQRNRIKRGGGRGRVSLDEVDDIEAAIESPEFDWIRLDRALDVMAENDARRHKVVTLRFFGGLDNRQIARELGIDERTVGRDWAGARLWLRLQLQDEDAGEDAGEA